MVSNELFIPVRLLHSEAFRRDLEALLTLEATAITEISTLGNNPNGFIGVAQATGLSERIGVSVEVASNHLSMVSYL